MARHQPEPENNPKFRPETRPKYSHTCPKSIGSGQVGRVFGPLLVLDRIIAVAPRKFRGRRIYSLVNLPQPFAKSFFIFLLNNNIIIQQAKQKLLALQAYAIAIGRLCILKQKALQNLIAYFAASWATILQHLLTQLKLHFKKNLRRSSILLIIVAMNQSSYNSDVVRGSKQDLASLSMMICCHFSLCASWIAQYTAAVSACIGEHHSCLLAQTLNTSLFLFLAPF